jgi:hypothetical protein
MAESIWAGWPVDLLPPRQIAERLAALPTRVEREVLMLRVPQGWRYFIGHLAIIGIATRIVQAESIEQRQSMLAEVPEGWRCDVEAHARRLWSRRAELRAGDWRPGRRPEREAA